MSNLFDRDRSAERLPVSLITGFLGRSARPRLFETGYCSDREWPTARSSSTSFGRDRARPLLVARGRRRDGCAGERCLCCAVRGDLQDTLRRLLIERDRGEVPTFARTLIETSASPTPHRLFSSFSKPVARPLLAA